MSSYGASAISEDFLTEKEKGQVDEYLPYPPTAIKWLSKWFQHTAERLPSRASISTVVGITASEDKREAAGIVGIVPIIAAPEMPEVTSVLETVAVKVAAMAVKAAEVMTAVEAVVPEDLVTAAVVAAMTSVTAGHGFRRRAKCHGHAQGGYRQD
jgi:hypothetical protein